MGIQELLDAEKNRFIDLLELLGIMSEAGQCHISIAAQFLHLKLHTSQASIRPRWEGFPCPLTGRVIINQDSESEIKAFSMLESISCIDDLREIFIYDDKPVRFKSEFRELCFYGFDRREINNFLSSCGLFIDIVIPMDVLSPSVTHDLPKRLQQLEAENALLVEQVADLERRLKEAAVASQDDEGPLHPKRETTYLNTIGALVELIQTPRPGRDSDAAVIREILDNYSERPGISKRTLEALFPQAKKRLQSD